MRRGCSKKFNFDFQLSNNMNLEKYFLKYFSAQIWSYYLKWMHIPSSWQIDCHDVQFLEDRQGYTFVR